MDTGDAGRALVGAILGTDGKVLDDLPKLKGEDFTDPRVGEIFDQAVKLWNDRKPVDLVTLSESVTPVLRPLVIECMEWTTTAYNAHEYAAIVERHAVRRELASAGAEIASFDPRMDPAEMIDKAQAILGRVVDRSVKPSFKFVGDLLDDVLVSIAEDTTFVPSPWRALNRCIGGFRPGAVYVVAARPGVGKTVVAAQIATALAEAGAVAFSSLEMSSIELVQRFISERAQVNVGHLKNNQLTDYDMGRINSYRDVLKELNIAIDDRTSISPADVRGFVRGLSRVKPVAGVVVDYLQLMSAPTSMERYQLVTEFSRQMKIIAKDFNVPVVVLSQLNRASESRGDGVPKISDLRESGAIEQDADVVMLLRREGDEPNETLILDVAKNRHGETAEVHLDWQGVFSRAVNKE